MHIYETKIGSKFVVKPTLIFFQVLVSPYVEETASLIRQIGDNTCSATTAWTKADWGNRHWITGQMDQV